MKNALDCYYDYKLDKFILLEDVEYKNNRDINLLIEELRQYVNLKNEQDINGEYEPPLEWEQGDVKLLLQYIENLKNGIYKILKLNEYMIHCESKEVIYKFLMKQWRTIYETLGIPEPGLARCSKNDLESKGE